MSHKLWINGEWTDSVGGGRMTVENPATGDKLAGVVRSAERRAGVVRGPRGETYFPDHFQNEDDFNGKGRVERVVLDDEGRPLEPKG